MKTLVLGGSGFLGAWTARALRAIGHSVTTIVRANDPWRLMAAGVDVVVAPSQDWANQIAGERPDVLVSFDWAGVAGAARDDARQWENVDRQRELFAAAVASGVRRIVGLGSQAEYGPRFDVTPESAELHPLSAYGESKVAAMQQLQTIAEAAGIEWVWARVFSVYGPMDNEGVLLQKVHDALRAARSIELTSGEQLWSYLYASDAARAMAALAASPRAEGVYNVGHPEAPRLRDTVEQFSAATTTGGMLQFGAVPGAAASVAHLIPDVQRLLSLGWTPEVPLREGMELTSAWLGGRSLPDPFRTGLRLPARPEV